MKTKKIFLFSCVLFTSLLLAATNEDEKLLLENNTPILFDTIATSINYSRERIKIENKEITDSLKIVFRVILDFEKLNEYGKPTNLKEIIINNFNVTNLHTSEKFSLDNYENKENWTKPQNHIWSYYSKLIKYWYENQPYEKVYHKVEKKSFWGGVLFVNT